MMYYKERFKDFFAIDELLCLQLMRLSMQTYAIVFILARKKRLCKNNCQLA